MFILLFGECYMFNLLFVDVEKAPASSTTELLQESYMSDGDSCGSVTDMDSEIEQSEIVALGKKTLFLLLYLSTYLTSNVFVFLLIYLAIDSIKMITGCSI